MPLPFEIVFRKGSPEAAERVIGTISDADWQLLKKFRNNAADLRTTKWVRAGLDARFTVRAFRGRTRITWRKKPSRAMVSELLHRLRPFVLKKEPTSYPRVNKLVRRCIDHEYIRADLDTARRIFQHGGFSLYGQLSVGSLPLYSSETFTRWLNAFEYHRDESHRQELEAALGGPPDDLALAVFYGIAADRSQMVMHLASVISALEHKSRVGG